MLISSTFQRHYQTSDTPTGHQNRYARFREPVGRVFLFMYFVFEMSFRGKFRDASCSENWTMEEVDTLEVGKV